MDFIIKLFLKDKLIYMHRYIFVFHFCFKLYCAFQCYKVNDKIYWKKSLFFNKFSFVNFYIYFLIKLMKLFFKWDFYGLFRKKKQNLMIKKICLNSRKKYFSFFRKKGLVLPIAQEFLYFFSVESSAFKNVMHTLNVYQENIFKRSIIIKF